MTTEVKTIDVTPTWLGILRMLLLAYSEGETATARNAAFAELQRMAQLADAYVAEHKKEK